MLFKTSLTSLLLTLLVFSYSLQCSKLPKKRVEWADGKTSGLMSTAGVEIVEITARADKPCSEYKNKTDSSMPFFEKKHLSKLDTSLPSLSLTTRPQSTSKKLKATVSKRCREVKKQPSPAQVFKHKDCRNHITFPQTKNEQKKPLVKKDMPKMIVGPLLPDAPFVFQRRPSINGQEQKQSFITRLPLILDASQSLKLPYTEGTAGLPLPFEFSFTTPTCKTLMLIVKDGNPDLGGIWVVETVPSSKTLVRTEKGLPEASVILPENMSFNLRIRASAKAFNGTTNTSYTGKHQRKQGVVSVALKTKTNLEPYMAAAPYSPPLFFHNYYAGHFLQPLPMIPHQQKYPDESNLIQPIIFRHFNPVLPPI